MNPFFSSTDQVPILLGTARPPATAGPAQPARRLGTFPQRVSRCRNLDRARAFLNSVLDAAGLTRLLGRWSFRAILAWPIRLCGRSARSGPAATMAKADTA